MYLVRFETETETEFLEQIEKDLMVKFTTIRHHPRQEIAPDPLQLKIDPTLKPRIIPPLTEVQVGSKELRDEIESRLRMFRIYREEEKEE